MINIIVPALGESVVEARVARWLKQEGDRVEVGEPIVELETEKVDLEVGADHGGILASIKRREGEDVKVGELLAVVDDSATAAAAQPAASQKATEAAVATPSPDEEQAKATPTARRMARDHDVRIGALQGSGAAGRVTKQDVKNAIGGQAGPARDTPSDQGTTSSGTQTPAASNAGADAAARQATVTRSDAPPAKPAAATQPPQAARPAGDRSEERVRMSKRRQTIARRLVEAQRTAAMLTTFNEIDMTALVDLRNRHKEAFKKIHGVGLGIASFFVKATVTALKAFPQINAEIQGDEIVLKHYYDIGMAVGAEGGLVVPVLRDADRMSFVDIERAIRDFAQRATDGTLTLADLTGGTFTITNGGVFGSMLSTPILNPPQVGILGLHAIEERPVAKKGQVVIRPMMYVALSYDHRIVDGREAVQFLVRVKELVEDPGHLLLES